MPSRRSSDARRNPLLRKLVAGLQVTLPQLQSQADGVIEAQVRDAPTLLRAQSRAGAGGRGAVRRWQHAGSESPRTGDPCTIRAEQFVIATGSRPYHPPGLDFSHPRVLDSDSVLRYQDTPFSVTIYGAGVIGCEYASIFLNLGVKVTLVNTQDRLLSFMDEEIAEALSYHLRDQGCIIRHNELFDHLEARESDVVLHLQSGRSIKSDVLLWANGRTGNTDGMNLEAVGLVPNQRGQLAVNERYQTAVPNIFAVGDVIGPPALASAAYQQGGAVGRYILDARSRRRGGST